MHRTAAALEWQASLHYSCGLYLQRVTAFAIDGGAAGLQVFLCYRCRGLGEEAFHAAAAAAGWAVEEVPCQLLHPEYQAGEYCVLRLMKTG